MDTQSQERLAQIIATGPDAITAADAEFLRARRSYLNEEQRVVFAAHLGEEETVAGPYDGLSLKKLKALAKEREIEVDADSTVETIVAALVEADTAAQQ